MSDHYFDSVLGPVSSSSELLCSKTVRFLVTECHIELCVLNCSTLISTSLAFTSCDWLKPMSAYSCSGYCCCLTGQIFQITQHSVFTDPVTHIGLENSLCVWMCLCTKSPLNQGQGNAKNATEIACAFTVVIERQIWKRWKGRKCSKERGLRNAGCLFYWKWSVMKDPL